MFKNCKYYLSILLATSLFSQIEYNEIKLTPGELVFGQMYGNEISTNGQDVAITKVGAIEIYSFSENAWNFSNEIDIENTTFGFGINTQFQGNRLFVSAHSEQNGRIYVYTKDGGDWIDEIVITNDEDDVSDFGIEFYFYNYFGLICAKESDDDGISHNLVYFYEFINGNWQQVERIDGEDNRFGSSLHLKYELAYIDELPPFIYPTAYIGDPSFDYPYENTGTVHVYYRIGGIWTFSHDIESPDPSENGFFGNVISRQLNYLFIASGFGMDNNLSGGKVSIFKWIDAQLIYLTDITSGDNEISDKFGTDLAGNDSTLVVGAVQNQDGGAGSGSAYIFKLENVDDQYEWVEYKKIISSDLNFFDSFGFSVAMTEDFAFIGAPTKDNLTGAVYIYDPDDNSLHSNFAGDVRNGNAPVTVQFTSVPQGNPTAYEWDFNSDGFVDSTEPNPQFTYQINGIYTVTLIVYDETGSDEEVKTDYIQVVSDILFGDVDQSGSLDVGDLVLFVAFVLGDAEPTEGQFIAGDVNYSGQIDIIDIVMVIHEILGD